MGASFEIAAWAPEDRQAATQDLLSEVLEAAAELERQISSWDPESETSALNRAAGLAPVAIGGDLRALVEIAVSWADRTGRRVRCDGRPATRSLEARWNPRETSDRKRDTERA